LATILDSNKQVADFIAYLKDTEISPGLSILDSYQDSENYLFLYFQRRVWDNQVFDMSKKVGDLLGFRSSYFFYDKKLNKMVVCYQKDEE
jgi:hypothetical protein